MMPAVPNPSRDRRVEDPTNLWLIDPMARLLVPIAVRLGISANAVSIAGLAIGLGAALAYARWQVPGWAVIGLLVSIVWLVMDSLDGMIARATNTSSAFGRQLDGLCDHGVFTLIYLALAWSVGGGFFLGLAATAGIIHAGQAALYEAERERFHRRLAGRLPAVSNHRSRNPAIRLYDWVASCLEPASAQFDPWLVTSPMRDCYERKTVPMLQAMLPLSQNLRLVALFVACLLGRMTWFLWYELVPLSLLTAIGVVWHRRIEAAMLRQV
jgi:CDP-diacylglycerol--serine O-phosphatidyltransferase